jgi:AcrR family transcriptional regulator
MLAHSSLPPTRVCTATSLALPRPGRWTHSRWPVRAGIRAVTGHWGRTASLACVGHAPGAARRGRPRDAAADDAILRATVDLLDEAGFDRLTIEAVAARAGVGKPTIYRRWHSKAELVVDAVTILFPFTPASPEHSDDDDIADMVLRFVHGVAASPMSRVLPALLASADWNRGLGATFRERYLGPRRAYLAALIRQAANSGTISPHADPEAAVDLLFGPLFYHWLASGQPPDERIARHRVTLAWRALQAGPDHPDEP